MSGQAPGSNTLYWAPKRIGDSLAKAIGGASRTAFNLADDFEQNAATWDRNTAAYAKTFLPALQDVNNFFAGASTGIASVETSVNRFYANVLNSVRKQVGTFSEHAAATVTDLSLVVRNPLDFQVVSNAAASIMNRISPGSSNALNQSLQNLHLDKLAKAPGLLFSGLQRLARAIDNVLSIPIAFVSSVYYGVIGLIKQIGTTLNNLIQGFQQFIFDFLDEALGGALTEILQLLDDIGTLASQIGGIASIFSGVNVVSGFALQITTFTTQINSIVSSPLDTVLGVLPENISNGYSEIMNGLQNPESLINEFLPDDLSAIFSKITSITGLGFNGNMGYGFASLLDGARGGVINTILTDFAAQYNILAPLLGGGNNGGGYKSPLSYNPSADNGYIQGKRYKFNPDTKIYELVQ
jgi:hypothetical protein